MCENKFTNKSSGSVIDIDTDTGLNRWELHRSHIKSLCHLSEVKTPQTGQDTLTKSRELSQVKSP